MLDTSPNIRFDPADKGVHVQISLTKPVCPGYCTVIIPIDFNEAQSTCEIFQDEPFDSNITVVKEVRELTGANISLSCICSNEFWRFGSVLVSNRSLLHITRLSGATAGPYTCYSTNETNTTSSVLVRAISKLL